MTDLKKLADSLSYSENPIDPISIGEINQYTGIVSYYDPDENLYKTSYLNISKSGDGIINPLLESKSFDSKQEATSYVYKISKVATKLKPDVILYKWPGI